MDKAASLPMVKLELIPDPEQGGFTAHVLDIPAYGEGKTEQEAISDLKKGLQAYIDEFGLDEALSRLDPPSYFRQFNLSELLGAAA